MFGFLDPNLPKRGEREAKPEPAKAVS
jgi:hypothetical protein